MEFQEVLQFINVLIVPLIWYLHRINERLVKLETSFQMLYKLEIKKINKDLERLKEDREL